MEQFGKCRGRDTESSDHNGLSAGTLHRGIEELLIVHLVDVHLPMVKARILFLGQTRRLDFGATDSGENLACTAEMKPRTKVIKIRDFSHV